MKCERWSGLSADIKGNKHNCHWKWHFEIRKRNVKGGLDFLLTFREKNITVSGNSTLKLGKERNVKGVLDFLLTFREKT